MDDFDKVFLCQSSNSQGPTVEPISICKCLFPESAEESLINSERKNKLLSRVANTETYLRERRIPELIRFILTKILANRSKHPLDFAWKLLDDCMLYRAGIGQAPVLYEERHLQAIVKSFDPGHRGWLSVGQVRRVYCMLGITPEEEILEKTPTDQFLDSLRRVQEQELFDLLTAGGNGTYNGDVAKSSPS